MEEARPKKQRRINTVTRTPSAAHERHEVKQGKETGGKGDVFQNYTTFSKTVSLIITGFASEKSESADYHRTQAE